METTKWYIAYRQIADALYDFQESCRSEKTDEGKKLYTRCLYNTEFRKLNRWFNKFVSEFVENKSLDPLHIFASFNSNKISSEDRKIRINILLEMLEAKIIINDIDFEGCPAINIIKVQSIRNDYSQKQIWDLFYSVYLDGAKGLESSSFENYKNWLGVELATFTIFLFWINSDVFLPVEKNTKIFLKDTGIVLNNIKDYNSYIQVLNLIRKFNYKKNEKYGSNGLFREITKISYDIISLGITDIIYTSEFQNLLNNKNKGKDIRNKDNIVENLVIKSNLGFRIIAIKPLEGCFNKYLNILKTEQIYYFENIFTIKENLIEFDKNKFINPYEKFLGVDINVNVTAIVGKNGSGKSSLVELLFRIINNISYAFKHELKTNDLKREDKLSAELYYILNGDIYCILVLDNEILIQDYYFNQTHFEKSGKTKKFVFDDFHKLFYTIAVNYSHYALNSLNIGNWIDELFHKNDGYQTPIVINPMRTKGNIDINVENDLVKSRLLSLLFSPVENDSDISIRQITEKQIAISVGFEIIRDKNKILFSKRNDKNEEVDILFEQLNTKRSLILENIALVFNIPDILDLSENSIIEETKNYIIRKLVKISINYLSYSIYFNQDEIEFDDELIITYLIALRDHPSHITYKLQQAINYLKHPDLISKEESFELNIEDFSNRLSGFLSKDENKNLKIIELLPPAIFRPQINLLDKESGKSTFDELSSGEKQIVNSVSSILYHLDNINSVNSELGDLINYKNINLLLDEIELYYHPDLQRKYLDYLLKMIAKLSLDKIDAINICLITHSPYILSDIHNTNILRLDEGSRTEFKEEQLTFGANIHDLLANDFFMGNGLIGEFARNKIEWVIKFINSSKKVEVTNQEKNEVLKIINLIGEPFLKYQLTEMFYEKFDSQKRIEELEIELKKLKGQ